MGCQRLRAHGPSVNFSEANKAREKRAEAIWEFWMMPVLTALAYSSRAKSKGMPSIAALGRCDGSRGEREAIAVFGGGRHQCVPLPTVRLRVLKKLAPLSTSRIRLSRS
jgi:hypothetical protein